MKIILTLSKNKLAETALPLGTGWLLGECMEYHGKQQLWIEKKTEVLKVLRAQAIIQSVESSNRIEGVTVDADRLRPLALQKAKPRDRSEEELAGYTKALDWIYSRKSRVRVAPITVLKLHSMAQGGFSGDAGIWKSKDNEIIEILDNGERKIRFVPTSATQTPQYVEALCRRYDELRMEGSVPLLLLIATFVFDLLSIHPFRDGNGRVSRLMTALLLESEGYLVPRFVSLERIIEENKREYYHVLQQCSEGWSEGTNNIIPWWNFFLSTLRSAYKEFETQVETSRGRRPKHEIVEQAILGQFEEFTLAQIQSQLPFVSSQLIKKTLAKLKAERKVSLTGRGRSARWSVET